MNPTVHVCWSEDSLGTITSLLPTCGAQDLIQVVTLGSKPLCLLRCLLKTLPRSNKQIKKKPKPRQSNPACSTQSFSDKAVTCDFCLWDSTVSSTCGLSLPSFTDSFILSVSHVMDTYLVPLCTRL